MKDYTIYKTTIQTQKLIMFAAIFQEELILFVPFEKEFCNKKLESFKKILKASNIVEDDSKFQKLKIELDEYFKNQRDNFTIPIRLIGTPFQIKCWEALQKIEYGETISYKEEAKNISIFTLKFAPQKYRKYGKENDRDFAAYFAGNSSGRC